MLKMDRNNQLFNKIAKCVAWRVIITENIDLISEICETDLYNC